MKYLLKLYGYPVIQRTQDREFANSIIFLQMDTALSRQASPQCSLEQT